MMNSFEKCVHVKDMSKVAYWRKHDGFGYYPLEDGPLVASPGSYAVWILTDDGPGLDTMSEDEFNERFVTESNLPEHFKDHLEEAPGYDDWCKSTYITKDDHNEI